MAIASKSVAALVSARELPKVVDEAIKAATAAGIASDGPLVVKWDLIGRQVRDLEAGEAFSGAVAKSLTGSGVKASPALLKIDKIIIAGFFERANIPQTRFL